MLADVVLTYMQATSA